MAAAKKTDKSTKSKELEDYYVGINGPVDVRRRILETSKESIGLLKQYAILKETKEEKDDLITRYKKTITDINTLLTRLKSELPKIKVHKQPKIKRIVPVRTSKINIKKDEPKEHHKKTELELLEEQLGNVEEQLKTLS